MHRSPPPRSRNTSPELSKSSLCPLRLLPPLQAVYPDFWHYRSVVPVVDLHTDRIIQGVLPVWLLWLDAVNEISSVLLHRAVVFAHVHCHGWIQHNLFLHFMFIGIWMVPLSLLLLMRVTHAKKQRYQEMNLFFNMVTTCTFHVVYVKSSQ